MEKEGVAVKLTESASEEATKALHGRGKGYSGPRNSDQAIS
jgi:hypothetical protein